MFIKIKRRKMMADNNQVLHNLKVSTVEEGIYSYLSKSFGVLKKNVEMIIYNQDKDNHTIDFIVLLGSSIKHTTWTGLRISPLPIKYGMPKKNLSSNGMKDNNKTHLKNFKILTVGNKTMDSLINNLNPIVIKPIKSGSVFFDRGHVQRFKRIINDLEIKKQRKS